MVNFMCQLELMGPQIIGKTFFPGVSMRVFPKRLAFELVD